MTGVEDSSIAPSERTDRVTTRPFVKCARVSSRARSPATSSAVSRSRGAAARITAPVPAAARPMALLSSATASHSWWRSGLPASSPARVPEASNHWSPAASTLRANHSGRARPTTAPSRASRGTDGSAVSWVPGASRSSRVTSRCHRSDSVPPPERNRRTRAGMSAEGTRAPSASAAIVCAALVRPTSSAPSRSARPQRGSTGSVASNRPRSVVWPRSSTAPKRVSSASASARARGGRGSGRANPSPPGVPHTASVRLADVRSAVRTSGTVWAGMAPQAASS